MNATDPTDPHARPTAGGSGPAVGPSAAPWARIGTVLFVIGVLAILADLVLFATGSRNLPVWLNVMCMLAPVGLGVGLVGVVREARANGRARATRITRDTLGS